MPPSPPQRPGRRPQRMWPPCLRCEGRARAPYLGARRPVPAPRDARVRGRARAQLWPRHSLLRVRGTGPASPAATPAVGLARVPTWAARWGRGRQLAGSAVEPEGEGLRRGVESGPRTWPPSAGPPRARPCVPVSAPMGPGACPRLLRGCALTWADRGRGGKWRSACGVSLQGPLPCPVLGPMASSRLSPACS